ncbi:MAG TPA: hypothetical protein VLM11_11775 [Streptosporangiaceae bacterium]|nr:hypothetical protein [Streptosporangiaceae bacterium]
MLGSLGVEPEEGFLDFALARGANEISAPMIDAAIQTDSGSRFWSNRTSRS